MEASHHVADDLRAFAVLGVGGQTLLPHRVQDAALHRLESVAHVRQRAGGDDRQRVVEVPRLRRLVQGDRLGRAGAVAAAENRRPNRRVAPVTRRRVGVEIIEERSLAGLAFGQCATLYRRGREGQEAREGWEGGKGRKGRKGRKESLSCLSCPSRPSCPI